MSPTDPGKESPASAAPSREAALRLLAEAGELLASSLDYRTTLANVARLAVPGFAAWCAVDVLEPDGSLAPVAVAHADPEKVRLAQQLRQRYPTEPGADYGAPNAIRTGRSELYREIPDELLVAAARDETHLALMRGLGMTSAIVAPMLGAAERPAGAITFVAEAGRRFDKDDLRLAEELARRAAVAVENARLHRQVRTIAQSLQQSLLPPHLPEIPGVEVAARFRAAGEGIEVGGDFYDLFETGRGDWAVVIGDVCGKGAEAAAVTALARYTLRAAAMQEERPSRVLAFLNEAILRQQAEQQLCTVAYGSLEVGGAGARLTLASGGHPLPLLLRGEGVATLGRPGTLLGAWPEPRLADHAIELEPGDLVVFSTDGVTETRTGEGLFGEQRLAALLGSCAGCDAAETAERIERAVLEAALGAPHDDIAILVLRVAAPGGGPAAGEARA